MSARANAVRASVAAIVQLSHELGREDRQLALLGEGNTSAKVDEETFVVKASGSNLAALRTEEVTLCRSQALLKLLEARGTPDTAVEQALLDARVSRRARKPSVEAMFHAWLLTLPGVGFVGHTHPVAVNALLCSGHGRTFARRRLFPDEIVCCDVASAYVPYTDPGLKLAQAIRRETTAFIRMHRRPPRVILLENHGLIALGATPAAVLAATLMADKAARIFLGAVGAGGPRFLSAANVARISGRPDEHHRRRMLGI